MEESRRFAFLNCASEEGWVGDPICRLHENRRNPSNHGSEYDVPLCSGIKQKSAK